MLLIKIMRMEKYCVNNEPLVDMSCILTNKNF